MSEETAKEITEIRVAIGRQGEQIKTLYSRLDKQDALIDTVNQLAISIEKLASGQEDIKKDIGIMRKDVDDLRQRPAKRWDAVVAAIITGVVAYIIGRITKGV